MSDELRAALDKALGRLSEDDLHYEQGVSMNGEPLDPDLFVNYEAIRAALAARPDSPTLDVERLDRALLTAFDVAAAAVEALPSDDDATPDVGRRLLAEAIARDYHRLAAEAPDRPA